MTAELRDVLAAATRHGQFEACPPAQRLEEILGSGETEIVRQDDRITGFATVGPLPLTGPPSSEAWFTDIIADDPATEKRLTGWAKATAARLVPGRPIRSLRGAGLAGPPGFTAVREIRRMDRALGTTHVVPDRPGLELSDAATESTVDWIGLINDSFADHWGGYLPWDPARWRVRTAPPADPALLLLARRDGEPAGVLLSSLIERADGGSQPVGFIEVVGTPPVHRRRGIAEYLVRAALARFAERGARRAVLLVDGGSDTRPAAVYARCGFEHVFSYTVWEFQHEQ